MHYKINEFLIKSELAAKSVHQPNQYVLKFIEQIPRNFIVLDYGCGKLRYSIPLAKRVSEVVAIDSREQILKFQIINGKKTTLEDICFENIQIYSIDNDIWEKKNYDLVFCTNVLSAIPYEHIRLELLKKAVSVLKKEGVIFIAVQYRNSFFSKYKTRSDAKPFGEGWLIRKNNTEAFYYAPLSPEYIVSLCEKVGLYNINVKKHDGSCYVTAQK